MEKIGLVIVTITWWLFQVNANLGGSPSFCKDIVYLHNVHVNPLNVKFSDAHV